MDPRTWFTTAADGFVEVARGLEEPRLDDAALGEWDVRALLGHTCRAFLTVETYLGAAATDQRLATPADYYVATRLGLGDPAAVTQRGRDAGAALGEHPVAAAVGIAQRVVALVAATPDDADVATPVGTMALRAYLPTRAFELTVHSLDLVRATDQDAPAALVDASEPALELCVALAGNDQRVDLLLALTGRSALDPAFSLL